jgi:hypothetical protein
LVLASDLSPANPNALIISTTTERFSARAGELRKGLADAPIVATSDPLPDAFNATLGRVLPLSGKEGVALLLTSLPHRLPTTPPD